MKRIPFIVSLLVVLTMPALLISSCNPRTHIYKRSQLLRGTIVEITVAARTERTAEEAINAAFKEIGRLEDIMSTYKPESDISKAKTATAHHSVTVHKDLLL